MNTTYMRDENLFGLGQLRIDRLALPKYKLRQRTFQVREGLTQSAHSVQNETGTESALPDHCGDITFLLNRKEHRYRELPTVHKSAHPSITAQGDH